MDTVEAVKIEDIKEYKRRCDQNWLNEAIEEINPRIRTRSANGFSYILYYSYRFDDVPVKWFRFRPYPEQQKIIDLYRENGFTVKIERYRPNSQTKETRLRISWED